MFVTCCTNMGEGLVKLSHMQGYTGCVEEWHIVGKTASKRVHYQSQSPTVTTERLTLDSLADFSWVQKAALHSCTEGMCHSSTCPGTSLHVTQFYQVFHHISIASNKHWGEKPGYKGIVRVQMCSGWLKVALLAIWSRLTQLQNNRNGPHAAK